MKSTNVIAYNKIHTLTDISLIFLFSTVMDIKYNFHFWIQGCFCLLLNNNASPRFPLWVKIFLPCLFIWCRTLSSSDDVQDRETEKSRLEEAFETCDRDLDELIVQHYAELTTAIRTYQSITERITSSRNKIKQVNWRGMYTDIDSCFLNWLQNGGIKFCY